MLYRIHLSFIVLVSTNHFHYLYRGNVVPGKVLLVCFSFWLNRNGLFTVWLSCTVVEGGVSFLVWTGVVLIVFKSWYSSKSVQFVYMCVYCTTCTFLFSLPLSFNTYRHTFICDVHYSSLTTSKWKGWRAHWLAKSDTFLDSTLPWAASNGKGFLETA